MIEIDRKELCNLLDVTEKGLQIIITRKQLGDRLLANGYTLSTLLLNSNSVKVFSISVTNSKL